MYTFIQLKVLQIELIWVKLNINGLMIKCIILVK